MCNIMAAVGGIALLAMMGGRGKKKSQEQQQPMLPQIKSNYTSKAGDQASTNKGLANDASSGVATSKTVSAGRDASAGSGGYRNPLSIPTQSPGSPRSKLPSIGGLNQSQKPVSY